MELFLRFSSRDKVENNKQLSMKLNSCFVGGPEPKYLIIPVGVSTESSGIFDARSETRAR
jgi:hypothetical protein